MDPLDVPEPVALINDQLADDFFATFVPPPERAEPEEAWGEEPISVAPPLWMLAACAGATVAALIGFGMVLGATIPRGIAPTVAPTMAEIGAIDGAGPVRRARGRGEPRARFPEPFRAR